MITWPLALTCFFDTANRQLMDHDFLYSLLWSSLPIAGRKVFAEKLFHSLSKFVILSTTFIKVEWEHTLYSRHRCVFHSMSEAVRGSSSSFCSFVTLSVTDKKSCQAAALQHFSKVHCRRFVALFFCLNHLAASHSAAFFDITFLWHKL